MQELLNRDRVPINGRLWNYLFCTLIFDNFIYTILIDNMSAFVRFLN